MKIQINLDTFDGAKFATKYDLDSEAGDFWVEGDELVCPSLESADVSDCVVDQNIETNMKVSQIHDAAYNYIADNFADPMGLVRIKIWKDDLPDNTLLQAAIASCLNWSDSIWQEYFVRKATVQAGGEADLDFSSFGVSPYSFSELSTMAAS